ncbi:F0F1 ATP synthase subunit epsilon [Salinicoccus sp. ID82-1]|uniref:ATP synthase epsilon chain n=1 Tax=Salinicoccus cyprini TaxID=2493691 RepID=A0A558ASR3_9STAP|nr:MULTISPECIES: F0F1 ATP synthase subunit epsilon [Salinicoccus]MCG1009903.1 F0F1 ATP synthase subunit epsilon [Salinicoccus sp. ID82-1]TVT27236.1 F0F1 ATP synthase subunit epsilon [Salinicoccus cyprini]
MSTIALDVVTPNGSVFSEEDCEIIILQTKQGELGVMAGHVPTVAALKIGSLRTKIDGQFEYFAVTDGFVEIRPEKVTVLVQAGEFAEDIDTDRATAARERAEALLQQARDEKVDRYRADLALQRAVNRLDVAKHK